MKLAKLSMIARNGIERLEKQGIHPDHDDIVSLHVLGCRLEHPDGQTGLSVLGNPVMAGSAILWPWSIGAERWFHDRACVWFEGNGDMEFFALCYSHAMAKQPNVMQGLLTRQDAIRAIQLWVQGCDATRNELTAALEILIPDRKPSNKVRTCPTCNQYIHEEVDDSVPPDLDDGVFFDLCARLMKCFPGTTMDYWLWSTPQALTMRYLERHARGEMAMGNNVERDAQMMATNAFEIAMRMIRDKHLAAKKLEEDRQATLEPIDSTKED